MSAGSASSVRQEVGRWPATYFGPIDTRVSAYDNPNYQAVGEVYGDIGFCSIFLVGKHTFLSAGHCFNTSPSGGRSVKLFGFGVGQGQLRNEFSGNLVISGTNTANTPYGPPDMAIVKVTSAPDYLRPLKIAAQNEIYIGQPAQNVGWTGSRRKGSCTIRNIVGGYILTDCPSDSGDSGGPLFILTKSGEWKVAGIDHSGKNGPSGEELKGIEYSDEDSEQYTNITTMGWDLVTDF